MENIPRHNWPTRQTSMVMKSFWISSPSSAKVLVPFIAYTPSTSVILADFKLREASQPIELQRKEAMMIHSVIRPNEQKNWKKRAKNRRHEIHIPRVIRMLWKMWAPVMIAPEMQIMDQRVPWDLHSKKQLLRRYWQCLASTSSVKGPFVNPKSMSQQVELVQQGTQVVF